MKNKVPHVFLIILLICICILMNGCATVKMGASFNKDGSIRVENNVQDTIELIRDQVHSEEKDLKRKGFTVNDRTDGFQAVKTYIDINDLVAEGGKIWNPDENYKGVQFRRGFLYDYVSIDLVFQGEKMDTSSFDQFSGMTGPEAAQWRNLAKQMLQAGMDSFKFDFILSIPYASDYTNADAADNDGKKLSWSLKKCFIDGSDVRMQAGFRIYHDDSIIFLITAGVILGITAIILLVFGSIKGDQGRLRKTCYSFAGIILLVLAATGGYIKYVIDHPPVLTSQDRVIAVGATDSVGNPLDKTIEKQNRTELNSVDRAVSVLQEKGMRGSVLGVSVIDSDGFAALVKDGIRYYFAVFDAKKDFLAEVHYPSQDEKKDSYYRILDFRTHYKVAKNGQKTYSPMIFDLQINKDDKNGVDAKLGTWNGDMHVFSVYALFKIDENDKVVPGKLSSGQGKRPSHYQAPLKEQRNVDISNILLTHLDSLRMDLLKRQVQLP